MTARLPAVGEIPIDGASLAAQVYARIRTALMRADYKPNQRLKIREIAASMGTSETPVREAIYRLAHDGAVEIKPRHYVRVRRATVAEYLEVRDIRLELETLAGERAIAHVGPRDIEQFAARHAALLAAERAGDYAAALQNNFGFHFGLYLLSAMPTLISTLESMWIRIGPVLSEAYPKISKHDDCHEHHEAILQALAARDAAALTAGIRQDILEMSARVAPHI